jgi:hypothetical protein
MPAPRKPTSSRPASTSNVNYSKGIMGSDAKTLPPVKVKTILGDRYVSQVSPPVIKNKSTGSGSGGGITPQSISARTLPATASRIDGGGGAPSVSIQSQPPRPQYIPPTLVKIPSRDVVDYQDADIPVELITNLLFENLGANELVKFERHDTIEGTNSTYDIISNLAGIKKEFDPSGLISRQKPDTSYFDIYNIKLEDKIPSQKYLQDNPKIDGSGQVNTTDYVYIDSVGNLVVELVNMNIDELVELEIQSDGTIYEGFEIDY